MTPRSSCIDRGGCLICTNPRFCRRLRHEWWFKRLWWRITG